MIGRIRSEKEYKATMKTIEGLLDKATRLGGFHKLNKTEANMLEKFSRLAETYEDHDLQLMPIKPKTLQEAVEFKMTERKWTQAQLARNLGIGAPKLSQILSGKREPDIKFLKAVHKRLKIDADFILNHV